jgi:hypothetical protein
MFCFWREERTLSIRCPKLAMALALFGPPTLLARGDEVNE